METFLNLPILKPLIALLHSRKFMIAIATLIIDMLISQEPKLEPMRAELLTVFTVMGGILMTTIAAEDVSLNNMVGKTEANPQTVINQSSAPIPPTIINTAPEPPAVSGRG